MKQISYYCNIILYLVGKLCNRFTSGQYLHLSKCTQLYTHIHVQYVFCCLLLEFNSCRYFFSKRLSFNSIIKCPSFSLFLQPLLCGSWRIFRGRWLQVAGATTSRNPLSLPRQPSPSSSHPLLSPGEIQFERARTSLKEGRKGAGFLRRKEKGGGVLKQRREKRWCAFW